MPLTSMQILVDLVVQYLYDENGALVIPTSVASPTARAKVSSGFSGLSEPTRRKLFANFHATHTIPVEDTSRRGAGSADHQQAQQHALPLDAGEKVLEFERACRMGEEPDGIASHVVTRQRLQGYIHDEWGVACSLQRVTALCKEWGLVMGEYKRAADAAKLAVLRQKKRQVSS